jgi:hypothetical protein
VNYFDNSAGVVYYIYIPGGLYSCKVDQRVEHRTESEGAVFFWLTGALDKPAGATQLVGTW